MQRSAFTLVELAIVLVIIGLIVGGVLVGRDLIKQGETRAQISQFEKFNGALRAFQGKYNGLPGDLNFLKATEFGMIVTSCTGARAARDGNGLIEGTNLPNYTGQFAGENGLFWADLSFAGLIAGTYPAAGATAMACGTNIPTVNLTAGATHVGNYLPVGRLGNGSSYVYVFPNTGQNWYGLSSVTGGTNGAITSAANLPVWQIAAIDDKLDDGLANSGNALSRYFNVGTIPILTTCYNNTTGVYNVATNDGEDRTCAITLRIK